MSWPRPSSAPLAMWTPTSCQVSFSSAVLGLCSCPPDCSGGLTDGASLLWSGKIIAPWAELRWPCCCLPADSKGRTAFMRHILGVTDEERQQRRCVGQLEGITCFLVLEFMNSNSDRAPLSRANSCTAP